jgi:FkbM family methyltransferase
MMIRKYVENLTGYWLHKARTLPIGTELRIDLLREGVEPGLIFDVGANIGQTYRRFRGDFPAARIISFEPVRKTFDVLAATLSQDSLAKAEHLAFGETVGTATMDVSEEWSVLNSLVAPNWARDAIQESIQIDTINDYCEREEIHVIDLLKIDTEGFEVPVIRGADRTEIRAVLCEVGFSRTNERNTYIGDVIDALPSHRFHGLYDVTHYEQGSFANALFLH